MTTENIQLVPTPAREARVNVTFAGANGELPQSVPVDASEEEIRRWATEALRTGGIPGIPRSEGANLSDFVVERFAATAELPDRVMIRPKTGYGLEIIG